MFISILKSVFNGLDVEYICFINESCGVIENLVCDCYIFEMDLIVCGIIKSYIEDFVIYMNIVEEIFVEDD